MDRSDSDLTSSARQALTDSAALAPVVPPDLLHVVEHRGRRSRTRRTTLAAVCAIGVAASVAFAATGESGPPPNVSAPIVTASKTGLPVVFAPVEQFRRREGSCTTGWLPGHDGCFRLAPNSLRVDNPRTVELITDQENGVPVVRLTMSDSDAARFRQIAADLAPRRGMLGIVVDDRVVSAPEILATLSGSSVDIMTDGPQEAVELFHQIT